MVKKRLKKRKNRLLRVLFGLKKLAKTRQNIQKSKSIIKQVRLCINLQKINRRSRDSLNKMVLEEIVSQILSSHSYLDREEVMKKIETKKVGARDFLTDETAARIVASELGVKITKKSPRLKIQIQDLISGLNDVTLTGQVVYVYPPKTFKRRDWTEGRLASMIISDKSGKLRVVLWDKKVDLVETGKIQQEQTIRISHGYVREGLDGKLELHVGEKGKIRVLTESPRVSK